jgi:hypothetical protein
MHRRLSETERRIRKRFADARYRSSPKGKRTRREYQRTYMQRRRAAEEAKKQAKWEAERKAEEEQKSWVKSVIDKLKLTPNMTPNNRLKSVESRLSPNQGLGETPDPKRGTREKRRKFGIR